MNKLLIAGGAIGVGIAAAAILAKRRMSSAGGFDFEQWIERMPEGAPPKWLFNNISAIRDNTERTLQLLEKERASAGEQE
jgi:hypothetical protein